MEMHTLRGMTLVELVTALAVFAVVMAAVAAGVLGLYRGTNAASASASSLAYGRTMTELFAHDMRQAMYSDAGGFPIADMATSSIAFYANLGSDASAEKISYTLSGTTVQKSVVTAGDPATYSGTPAVEASADDVRNNSRSVPVFRYYDASGNEVTDASYSASVRMVTMTLVENAATSSLPDIYLETEAALRNLIAP